MKYTYVLPNGVTVSKTLNTNEIVLEVLYALLIFMLLAILFIAIAYLFMNITGCYGIITPNRLYEETDMNKISCWLISILFYLNPAVLICVIIYFLTHVGRNDD